MTDECVVLNGHPLADECVTLNLAILANLCPFLYFYKRPDFSVVTNLTTIQIHEILNAHILTKFHIGSNFFHFSQPRSDRINRIYRIVDKAAGNEERTTH